MILRYFCIVLFSFTVSFAHAQESMMPDVSYEYLDKLVATAKANYPKMKAYDHSVRIAELNIQKTKLDWFNLLSFIYILGGSTSPGFLGGFQTGISVSIGSILQKPGEVRTAKEELKIATLSQDEYNLSLEAIVKQRYFAYVQALTLLNWRTKDLQNAESTLKDIKYKFEKGEETFENYNKAQTFYSSGVQGKISAEGALLQAKSSLEEMLGAKLETIK